jgi:hypothetical protein
MITIPQLIAQALASFLSQEADGRFGLHFELAKLLPFAAKLAMECIGNSDALYYTMLVTLVGHDPGRTGAATNHHLAGLRELHSGLPHP